MPRIFAVQCPRYGLVYCELVDGRCSDRSGSARIVFSSKTDEWENTLFRTCDYTALAVTVNRIQRLSVNGVTDNGRVGRITHQVITFAFHAIRRSCSVIIPLRVGAQFCRLPLFNVRRRTLLAVCPRRSKVRSDCARSGDTSRNTVRVRYLLSGPTTN